MAPQQFSFTSRAGSSTFIFLPGFVQALGFAASEPDASFIGKEHFLERLCPFSTCLCSINFFFFLILG